MKEAREEGMALYRKYRPQNFSEAIGQQHITKVLEGSIKLGRISHAYLFTGSRGIGKTSMARIFAKSIGISQNDITEIDAASNTGVDDIRNLNESVNVLPFESKYKVYIVDEVHMLSKSAFNALLKTLEEPPKHVIFILVTTETEKLPETVVSRCQVFNFARPNQKILKQTILDVSKKEGFSLEQSSADMIAMLGDGSFRDALGILQKVISASSDKKISVEEVEMVTGAPKAKIVNDFIEFLEARDIERALETTKTAVDQNIDPKVFIKLVLRKLRYVLLLKYAPSIRTDLEQELSEEDFNFLMNLSRKKDLRIDSSVLLEILNAYDQMGTSVEPEIPLELALIKLVSAKENNETDV